MKNKLNLYQSLHFKVQIYKINIILNDIKEKLWFKKYQIYLLFKEEMIRYPLRFTILNRFHQNEGKLRGTCLLGKLHSGQLEKNINYVILLQGIFCEVKEVERQSVEGDILEIKIKTLIDSEFQNIHIGSVLSQIEYHVPVANRLVCQISTLDLQTPFIKGSQFLMHLGAQKIGVVVKKLNHIYDEDAQKIKKKYPRAIVSNELAEIELECDGLICVETHTNLEQLSRIIMREKFNIIGIGKVTIINVNLTNQNKERLFMNSKFDVYQYQQQYCVLKLIYYNQGQFIRLIFLIFSFIFKK